VLKYVQVIRGGRRRPPDPTVDAGSASCPTASCQGLMISLCRAICLTVLIYTLHRNTRICMSPQLKVMNEASWAAPLGAAGSVNHLQLSNTVLYTLHSLTTSPRPSWLKYWPQDNYLVCRHLSGQGKCLAASQSIWLNRKV
jgi:hypothetical protein